ncbi:pentapeptide repeat-containing protein [Planktothrix agardhii]|uniref:pentapeptide repeat-containing protein n=1 Tax=Planktothrix agardhii TaxID=1160 RepID=UPI001D0A434A|nr:pentapeptide repeat-containing protein [Planktothrix agardhii]MCB8781681.1 pentapeptide repeat-containing protein [Planktothrix agardhii 1808]MCF3607513.1 pentapeptide repeat-containing protein [Planktothrix agardhii 1033]MCB8767140.1 pentapeptide repeat-containing protein [Planktothrix agardhii 1809]MCB8777257.1 pentapeptide repeat-containing protein [Planktothrix agardhii 1031]MCF3567134.1 pentapeptide repeat-containing protein [Planktothrix agardhii 1807]
MQIQSTIDSQELLRRYLAGERDFNHINLIGAHLCQVNLVGANLIGASLDRADLTRAILHELFLVRLSESP